METQRKRKFQFPEHTRKLSARPKRGGQPLNSTTFGTRNPPGEVSLQNGDRNSKDWKKNSHHKQTPYDICIGGSRYLFSPDISSGCYSKGQGNGQEHHSIICKNGFYQRAWGGSADRKGRQCQKGGRNNEDISHPVILHLWWILERLICIHVLRKAYGKHRNIRHALSCADLSALLHDCKMET